MIRSLLILILLASPAWSQCGGGACYIYPGYQSSYESRGVFRSERASVSQPSVVVRQPATSRVVLLLSDGGTGVVLKTGQQGEVISCAHGLERGIPSVRMPDGSWQPASLMGIDRELDVALLRVNVTSGVVATLSDSLPRVGEVAGWEGYPGGRMTRKAGRVSAVFGDSLTLNITAYSGCSGGPITNQAGQVIGILAGTRDDTGETIGTHCIAIRRFLAKARATTQQEVAVDPPEKPIVDWGPMVAVVEQHTEQITSIEKRLTVIEERELLPGPAGPQGEPGKDGANGKDGRDGQTPDIDYERLAAEVVKLQPKPEPAEDGPIFYDVRPRR